MICVSIYMEFRHRLKKIKSYSQATFPYHFKVTHMHEKDFELRFEKLISRQVSILVKGKLMVQKPATSYKIIALKVSFVNNSEMKKTDGTLRLFAYSQIIQVPRTTISADSCQGCFPISVTLGQAKCNFLTLLWNFLCNWYLINNNMHYLLILRGSIFKRIMMIWNSLLFNIFKCFLNYFILSSKY